MRSGLREWEDLGVTRKVPYFILQFSSPISRFSSFAIEDFGQFLFRSALCENRTFAFAFQFGHVLDHVFVVVVFLCLLWLSMSDRFLFSSRWKSLILKLASLQLLNLISLKPNA